MPGNRGQIKSPFTIFPLGQSIAKLTQSEPNFTLSWILPQDEGKAWFISQFGRKEGRQY